MPPTLTVEKLNGDIATLGDVAAQAYIIEEIRRRFPDDGIKAEEGAEVPLHGINDVVWHVDPLDGTLNFKRHMGPWAVSIGVIWGDKIVAGCVVEGMSGDVFTAALDYGAQRNGRSIRVSSTIWLRTPWSDSIVRTMIRHA